MARQATVMRRATFLAVFAPIEQFAQLEHRFRCALRNASQRAIAAYNGKWARFRGESLSRIGTFPALGPARPTCATTPGRANPAQKNDPQCLTKPAPNPAVPESAASAAERSFVWRPYHP